MSNQEPDYEDDQEVLDKIQETVVKDLENKNKALEERNNQLINKNTELEEALKQSSFVSGNTITKQLEFTGAAAIIIPEWDYEFKDITLIHLRPQLMNLYAEVGDQRFDIFLKKK